MTLSKLEMHLNVVFSTCPTVWCNIFQRTVGYLLHGTFVQFFASSKAAKIPLTFDDLNGVNVNKNSNSAQCGLGKKIEFGKCKTLQVTPTT